MSTDAHYVRTTVSIREDIYQRLKRNGRTISEAINEALATQMERKTDLFGRFPDVDTSDLRDHEDRV